MTPPPPPPQHVLRTDLPLTLNAELLHRSRATISSSVTWRLSGLPYAYEEYPPSRADPP